MKTSFILLILIGLIAALTWERPLKEVLGMQPPPTPAPAPIAVAAPTPPTGAWMWDKQYRTSLEKTTIIGRPESAASRDR